MSIVATSMDQVPQIRFNGVLSRHIRFWGNAYGLILVSMPKDW